MDYLFIGEGTISDQVRMGLYADWISQDTTNKIDLFNLSKHKSIPEEYQKKYDVVIYSRPSTPQVMAFYKNKTKHLIADIDDNFWKIPKHHVGYQYFQTYKDNFTTCLDLAHTITVSTPSLSSFIKTEFDHDSSVIPNGWKKTDVWDKQCLFHKPQMKTILWGGTITHRADFELCKDAVLEICKKDKDTRIVIMGDYELYKPFIQLHDTQRLYLPTLPFKKYVYMLGLADVILAPLLNDEFNKSKSDIRLVQATAKKIPFVASDVINYRNFYNEATHCGYIAKNKDEWISGIKSAFDLTISRRPKHIMQREQKEISKLWEKAISHVRV